LQLEKEKYKSNEMRRTTREVTDFDQIIDIMSHCDVCRLALNDEKYPYILPLNFAFERQGQTVVLYFHGATEGRKYELIAQDPHVSFEMDCCHKLLSSLEDKYCTMTYASVIGHGTIEIVGDEEKVTMLASINNRYHKEGFPVNEHSVPHTTVMKLVVEGMTAKSNVKKLNNPRYKMEDMSSIEGGIDAAE
jgi:nitroimidazol reductase NimA-like FMN-containing flavoprotein (pyridoxamine 5'-phosphate oxidase superfamily)